MLYDRLVTAEILAVANPSAEFLYAGKHEGEQEAGPGVDLQQIRDRVAPG